MLIENCHIITVERINGEYRYYDPQNGKVITDFVGYIDGIKTAGGIKWLRVDNLRVNPDIAKKVLTKPAKDTKTGETATSGTSGIITPLTAAQKARKAEIKELMINKEKNKYQSNLFNQELTLPNKSVREWLNQPHAAFDAKNEGLLNLQKILNDCRTKIEIPVKPKHSEAVSHAYALPIKIEGKDSWIIVHEMKWGELKIYGISDDGRILEK